MGSTGESRSSVRLLQYEQLRFADGTQYGRLAGIITGAALPNHEHRFLRPATANRSSRMPFAAGTSRNAGTFSAVPDS